MKSKSSLITQQAFFNLSEVKAQQDIQKQSRYGHKAHKDAYLAICDLAQQYGVVEQSGLTPETY